MPASPAAWSRECHSQMNDLIRQCSSSMGSNQRKAFRVPASGAYIDQLQSGWEGRVALESALALFQMTQLEKAPGRRRDAPQPTRRTAARPAGAFQNQASSCVWLGPFTAARTASWIDDISSSATRQHRRCCYGEGASPRRGRRPVVAPSGHDGQCVVRSTRAGLPATQCGMAC